MVSGAGFRKIQESSESKFELSAKKEYLRKTLYRKTGFLTKEKTGEELYRNVDKAYASRVIKQIGGKWIPYEKGRIGNKLVYEHVDTRNFITGWYKIRVKINYPDGSHIYEYSFYKREGE